MMAAQDQKRNIETAYPLSPMQQGMLFHYVYEPDSAVYFEQMCVTVQGQLDLAAFQQSWQQLLDRHTILRTAFTWKKLDRMLQVVYKSVALPFQLLDWRHLTAGQQQEQLQVFLRDDRSIGFNLAKAPLMRLTLIQVGGDQYHLIWSHHHLLLDGWSNSLVLHEVFTVYNSLVQGQPANLSPSRPYRDYINWLEKADRKSAEDYWRRAMADFAEPTPLLIGQPSHSAAGSQDCEIFLDIDETDRLLQTAREIGVTANTLFQAAWALLLARYNRVDEVCYGSTVSGRPVDLPGVDQMVGLFINTLPVRVNVSASMPLKSFLLRLQEQLAEMRQYEYMPLVEIQSYSKVPRQQNLFESIAVFENFPLDPALKEGLAGLVLDGLQNFSQTNYPITVVSGPGKCFPLRILYDPGRFEPAVVERMLAHLRTLLESFITGLDTPVGELPLISPAERELMLHQWNQTEVPIPDSPIHSLFEERARLTPGAVAVRFADRVLTYQELDQRANQLANTLLSRGLKKGGLVGICLERSEAQVTAILAVLKAGGVFLPLDPANPPDRLAMIAEDAAFPYAITQVSLLPLVSAWKNMPLILLVENVPADHPQTEFQPVSVSAEDPAYVIYTSGSTGKPKGALLRQRGLVNFIDAYVKELGVKSSDVLLQYASLSFDAALCDIFIALTSGASLVLIPSEKLLTVAELTELVNHERVTMMTLTPSVLRLLPASELPGVEIILSAGEACQPDLVETWAPGRRFFNGYGPTETSIGATISRLYPQSKVTIGRPIQNTRTYILDDRLQPVPVGIPGELYIAGTGVGIAYLNRPDLTEQRFLSDPFHPGERMYRTGDLARYQSDGCIEFLGRVDFQVKIRGNRVELGEIETALLTYPEVGESAVLAHTRGADIVLVSYLTPLGVSIDLNDLREHIRKRLPEYMIPFAYVILDNLPLTPSGKIDRLALAQIPYESAALNSDYTAPRTAVEQGLSELYSQVLQRSQVGIHEDFFELGGHSLLATQLNSRIRSTFKVDLPIRKQFEHATVAQLAEDIEQLIRTEAGVELAPIVPAGPGSQHTLSHAQQRMWFLNQLGGASPAYNIPVALRLLGNLDIPALEKSLEQILTRHEILRSQYMDQNGAPVQQILSPTAVSLSPHDLSYMLPEEKDNALAALLQAETNVCFDLQSGPLLRMQLFRLSEQEHVISVVMHHIVSDGWSIGILLDELTRLYHAYHNRQPSPLPPLPVQYSDYAVWQHQMLSGESLDAQLDYWLEQLKGQIPVLELPTDHPRPAVLSSRGDQVNFQLDPAVLAQLKQLGHAEGATLFMLFLAAYQALLYRYTGQEKFAVGSPVANRTRSEIEPLVGLFVNTLVLKADLSGEPTFRQLLERVKNICLGAYAHQDMPFEMLVDRLQPERDLAHSALFQVAFGLTQSPALEMELSGVRLQALETATQTAKFDLTLEMSEHPGGLTCTLEYNTDLYERITIERMVSHLQHLLQSAVSEPDLPVSRLPLFDRDEMELLSRWGSGSIAQVPEICIHHRFEQWAEAQPDSPALQFDGITLTYAQVNNDANRLSACLQESGFVPGQVAGVCFERGFAPVIASLAVLKAGGAFLPLDPTYPPDRLAFMIQDSQAALLLTQSDLQPTLEYTGPVILIDKIPLNGYTPCIDPRSYYPSRPLYKTHTPRLPEPSDPAYLIYTSGSTGKPKGALLAHRGLVNLAQAQQAAFAVQPGSRILQFSPLSFDASVWEMVMALANGAALVLARQETLANPVELIQFLEAQQITHVTLPPSMLKNMPDAVLPALRTVIAAGEACPAALVQRWGNGRQFVNAYGPTETTVCASMYNCPIDEAVNPPIGVPLPNFQLYVLDSHQQLAPAGVPGELCVAGVGLALGYLNRPDLTSEKFIEHPLGRLYRTGDLVRWRADGNLLYLGRIDQQVKLRGFRIELGEIESALRAYPGIADAAANVHSERMYAYLTLQPDQAQPAASDLRQHLRTTLPEYMLPAGFIYLPELPLSPAGKVDRKALPAPDSARPDLEHPYVAPRNPTEARLAGICGELLGLEQVGMEDSFFELGGHSLLATQLASHIRTEFQVDLPLRTIFEYPSISQLAAQIESASSQQDDLDKISAALSQIENLDGLNLQQLLGTQPQGEITESYGD